MGFEDIKKLVKRRKPTAATTSTIGLPAALPEPLRPAIHASTTRQLRDPTQRVTAAQMRELRELIRHRYALDIEIWGQRTLKFFSRDVTRAQMSKSDAALREIQKRVMNMDRRENFASDLEYEKFREIKARILEEGKRDWASHPPWVDAGVGQPSAHEMP